MSRHYDALVAFMESVVGVADAPPPTTGATTSAHYYGPVHHGDTHEVSITGSKVGAVASGKGSAATGSVKSLSGDTAVTRQEFKDAISSLQASLLGVQDKLEKVDGDLYEDSSNILVAVRKLALKIDTDTATTVGRVTSLVADAFDEDDLVKAKVAEMKPGALAKVAETTRDLAKLSSDPIVRAIGGIVAQAMMANLARG